MIKGLLFLMLVSLFSQGLRADTLNIIGIPGAPYRFYNAENELVGFDVDILDEIMSTLDVEYRIKLIDSSMRLTQMWQDPDVDMVFTLSKKAQRIEYLFYAAESHINISWNFFILKENKGKIFFNTYEDLAGLRVGATNGFAYTPAFWNAAREGVFTLDTVVNNTLNLKKLIHGRFDTFASNTIETLYSAKQSGYLDDVIYLEPPLKQTPYFNTFVKVSDYPHLDDLIQGYNHELKQMKQDGRYQRIYQKYFGQTQETL